jgi:hypothetical protein
MRRSWVFAIVISAAAMARAADVGIVPKKLVVVDKRAASGTSKVVFVARDPAITKGAGLDPADISARLVVDYGAAAGQLDVPPGASDGTAGWLKNDATRAKFVNRDAPLGPTEAGVALVKPGKVLTLKAKGLGAPVLDVAAAGAPAGSVFVNYEVTNGGMTSRHCAEFPPGACTYRRIARDTGAKLVCRDGVTASSCSAASPFCGTYQDCAEGELCLGSRCMDEQRVAAQLPGVIAAALAEPVCLPRGSFSLADYCYTNSGPCTPGCVLSASVGSVEASWSTESTLRIQVQYDVSSTVPIDMGLLGGSCTLDWAADDASAWYDASFAADGTVSWTIVVQDAGAVNTSGCSLLPSLGEIVPGITDEAITQVTFAILGALQTFLQP